MPRKDPNEFFEFSLLFLTFFFSHNSLMPAYKYPTQVIIPFTLLYMCVCLYESLDLRDFRSWGYYIC